MQQPPPNQPNQTPWGQPQSGYLPPQSPQQPNTSYTPQEQWQQQQPPQFAPQGCVGIFALVSTAAKNVTTGTITSSNGSSSSSSSSTGQIAKVGQSITISDVTTMLVSVKTLAGDEFSKPKPGNEFVVVHIKMVNNGSSEQDYNPFDFHVKSGTGNITDMEIVVPSSYTANNQLQSGKLSARGTVEGDIVFQAPRGDHKSELTWQPSFFGNSGDNGWYLGL